VDGRYDKYAIAKLGKLWELLVAVTLTGKKLISYHMYAKAELRPGFRNRPSATSGGDSPTDLIRADISLRGHN
jgi:hypothetical protein